MSEATDLLWSWFTKAAVRAPSITRTGAQRWPGVGTGTHFRPGIASYGWGINGHLRKDPAGTPTALSFSSVYIWFSDRGLDLTEAPPASGQQFLAGQSDRSQMELRIAGDNVELWEKSWSWGFQVTCACTWVDPVSGQFVFRTPGAGPNAPQALQIVSLADTGEFGWV